MATSVRRPQLPLHTHTAATWGRRPAGTRRPPPQRSSPGPAKRGRGEESEGLELVGAAGRAEGCKRRPAEGPLHTTVRGALLQGTALCRSCGTRRRPPWPTPAQQRPHILLHVLLLLKVHDCEEEDAPIGGSSDAESSGDEDSGGRLVAWRVGAGRCGTTDSLPQRLPSPHRLATLPTVAHAAAAARLDAHAQQQAVAAALLPQLLQMVESRGREGDGVGRLLHAACT